MRKFVTSLLGGAIAGVVATYSMDRVWFGRYRERGGEDPFLEWEVSEADSFDEAGAPAQVAQAVTDAVGVQIPEEAAGTATNVVHWMTGIGWGMLAGLTRAGTGASALHVGLGTGVAAWGTAYAVLPRLGIYEPITEYDLETLWEDLSAHLVFGLALGLALRPAIGLIRRN